MPKPRGITAKLAPVHPGEILNQTLNDLGLSMNQLAHHIHVPANRISACSRQRRLARSFTTTAGYWMNLQAHFDLAESPRDA
jgi:antitoxin HigA-1